MQSTGPVVFGRTYCGYHHVAQEDLNGLDKDYFSFAKGAGGTLTINVTNLGNSAQVQLLAIDGNTQLALRGGAPFTIVCVGASVCSPGTGSANAAGTYYVRVSTPLGYSPTSQYQLLVTYAP